MSDERREASETRSRLPGTSIGDRICIARIHYMSVVGREVQMAEIADRVGVSRSIYTLWEQDKRTPKLRNFVALAKALGTSPCWLAFGDASSPLAPTQEGA